MKTELESAIATTVQDVFGVTTTIELTRPDERFGDYATNAALQLSKQLGQNPRAIAEQLAPKLQEALPAQISSITVAGPGFLNVKLTDAALVAGLQAMPQTTHAGQKILVEYSDPNPLKPLHAGHLYTTLVGDSIATLLQVAGAEVIRLNYGGDVGLHVGKSLWAIIRELGGEFPEKLHDIVETDRPSWLGARYVEGNTAYDDDAAAKLEIVATNKHVYELHAANDHASAFAQIYWTVRQWSYDYSDELYDQLQVHPFDRVIPESEVTPLGVATVCEQLKRGVYKESEGAIVFDGEPYGLHTRVFINSQGLPTYEAKDVGLMLTKWQDYHYDLSYYITANEQAQYFQVMFKSVEQFLPEAARRAVSITHGSVKLQGGVKMSSRKGNIVLALDIIEAAQQAGQDSGRNPSEEITLAAIKYAFAKNRIGGDIAYDPKESIALEGNSGPYLQYAHARARSILGKPSEGTDHPDRNDEPSGSDRSFASLADDGLRVLDAQEFEADERSLLRKIGEYSEVVDRSVEELMPHHICTYLYELAQQFNRFYERNRVLGDERQAVRLQLVAAYAQTLKTGLNVLGITAPDRL